MLGKYDDGGRVILARNETAARAFVADHPEYRHTKYIGSRAATLGRSVREVIVVPDAHYHRLHAELFELCTSGPCVATTRVVVVTRFEAL